MSSKEEKRAEEAVKSSHKKEKKRKSMGDVPKEASPSLVVAGTANGVNGASSLTEEDKKAKKERKAEKKRLRKEAEARTQQKSNGEVTVIVNGDGEARPMKRSKTVEETGTSSKEDRKAAKKRAKEEKKVKAAGQQQSSSVTASTSAPTKPAASSASAAAARAYMETNSITIEALEASEEKPPYPMLSFAELHGKIDPRLEKELERNKFTKPTPIQACCWSVLLANLDVVGIAETG